MENKNKYVVAKVEHYNGDIPYSVVIVQNVKSKKTFGFSIPYDDAGLDRKVLMRRFRSGIASLELFLETSDPD